VTTGGVAQRKAIDRVYAMIANGSPAQVEIGEFFRSDPPYERAQTKTVVGPHEPAMRVKVKRTAH
jgi:type IV secretory pathway TrbF-like protein